MRPKHNQANKPLQIDKEQDKWKGLKTSFLGTSQLLWGFVVPIPPITGVEATIKAAELATIEPRSLLRAASRLSSPLIGRVVNPPLPLFPRIGGLGMPQSVGAVLPSLLLLMALAAIGGGIVVFLKEPSRTRDSSEGERPVPLPYPNKKDRGGLVYIKTQGGFPPSLITPGSLIICNCDIPEIALKSGQVGCITQFCEDGWVEMGFNTNKGPWLDPTGYGASSNVGWPLSLLHATCDASVDLTGIKTEPQLFDVYRDWKPMKGNSLWYS